jgi:KRAB domain-containing zinc finger protein
MKLHSSASEIKYFCEQCSFVAFSKSRLLRHALIHSREKPFSCGQCDYQATQKDHVYRHLRLVHGIEIADRRRRTPSAKKGRKLSTATKVPKEKHFLCNFCTMSFNKLLNLHKHVQVQHPGLYSPDQPGKYSCVICTYTTGHWNNLLVHMRKHSFQTVQVNNGELVFACVICDFTCSLRNELHEHMNSEHKINLVKQEDSEADNPTVQVQLAPGMPYSEVEIKSPPNHEPERETDVLVGNYMEINGDVYLVQSCEILGE